MHDQFFFFHLFTRLNSDCFWSGQEYIGDSNSALRILKLGFGRVLPTETSKYFIAFFGHAQELLLGEQFISNVLGVCKSFTQHYFGFTKSILGYFYQLAQSNFMCALVLVCILMKSSLGKEEDSEMKLCFVFSDACNHTWPRRSKSAKSTASCL